MPNLDGKRLMWIGIGLLLGETLLIYALLGLTSMPYGNFLSQAAFIGANLLSAIMLLVRFAGLALLAAGLIVGTLERAGVLSSDLADDASRPRNDQKTVDRDDSPASSTQQTLWLRFKTSGVPAFHARRLFWSGIWLLLGACVLDLVATSLMNHLTQNSRLQDFVISAWSFASPLMWLALSVGAAALAAGLVIGALERVGIVDRPGTSASR